MVLTSGALQKKVKKVVKKFNFEYLMEIEKIRNKRFVLIDGQELVSY
jgi:hypothetical protein